MEFLEKDLEEVIYLADKVKLMEKGLDLNGKLFRQLRIGNYGICDLLHVYKNQNNIICFEIIELKKDKIGISAFLQAVNYIRGVQMYLKYVKKRNYYNYNYEITLIGKKVDDSGSFIYLPNICDKNFLSINFYTYSYDENGIYFNLHNDYSLIDNGF
jgi:hypothetical protein